jgi:hypothetical protein
VGIWPFSRKATGEPEAGEMQEVHVPGAIPAGPAGEWATLPAVQPSFEAIGLTLGERAFEASLVTRNAPEPFLAPLGHEVRSEGPTGTVGGVVTPAVQRFAAPPPTRFGVLVPDTPATVPPPSPAPAGGPVFGDPEPAAQRSTLGPEFDLPLRTLPVLGDGGAGDAAGGTPMSGPAGDEAGATPGPVADLLGAQETEAPLQGLWEAAAPRPPTTDDGPAAGDVPQAPVLRLAEAGDERPRRLGLGEPMTAVPSPIQRLLARIETESGSAPPPAPSPTVPPRSDAAAPFPVPRLGAPLSSLPSAQRQADRPAAPLRPSPTPGAEPPPRPEIVIFESPAGADTVVSRSAEVPISTEPPPPPTPPAESSAAPAPMAYVVQREAESTPGPGPEPAGTPHTPGSVAVGPGGIDLDELARRLYGRMSQKLRAELRLDRERAGFLSDLGR